MKGRGAVVAARAAVRETRIAQAQAGALRRDLAAAREALAERGDEVADLRLALAERDREIVELQADLASAEESARDLAAAVDLSALVDANARRRAVAHLCGGLAKVARVIRRGEAATVDERIAAVRTLKETSTGIEQLRENAGVAERDTHAARRALADLAAALADAERRADGHREALERLEAQLDHR